MGTGFALLGAASLGLSACADDPVDEPCAGEPIELRPLGGEPIESIALSCEGEMDYICRRTGVRPVAGCSAGGGFLLEGHAGGGVCYFAVYFNEDRTAAVADYPCWALRGAPSLTASEVSPVGWIAMQSFDPIAGELDVAFAGQTMRGTFAEAGNDPPDAGTDGIDAGPP